MVKVAVAELEPTTPFITAVVVATTGVVVTLKLVLVAPLGTVTELGADAAVFDELIETTRPFVPAFDERVTVPVDMFPPPTDAGERVSFLMVCACDRCEIPATKTSKTISLRNPADIDGCFDNDLVPSNFNPTPLDGSGSRSPERHLIRQD
jgi:hypothetical protein